MIFRITVLAVCIAALGADLVSAQEVFEPVQQTTCPVMEGTPIDRSLYTDYKGRRVYFCCKLCKKTFADKPEKYISDLPQFATKAETPDTHHKHDHSTDHEGTRASLRLLQFVGKFHPIAVHIPIALVLVAAMAEALAVFTGKDLFQNASRFNIIIAMLGAVASVLLGFAAGMSSNYPDEYSRPLFLHKWLGVATCTLIFTAAILSELACRRSRPLYRLSYRAILLICVVLVAATGRFGGQLVYGLNHYAW